MLTRHRTFLLSLCLLVAIAAAPPVSAQRITRCVDPVSGNVTYSDRRCLPATPAETGDGPCDRQAEIAMAEIAKKEPIRSVGRAPSVTKESTPEIATATEREVAASGLLRADPTIVARVVKSGLSARCRAVLEKQGPTGPEWYGTEVWSTLRAEAEKRGRERALLSDGLRRKLQALLETARRAHEIAVTGGLYEEFSLQVAAVRGQQESIRSQYALALKAGDHQPLVLVTSQTAAALFAVDPDVKKERDAAINLAAAQDAAMKYRNMESYPVPTRRTADETEQWLARARQEHDQARARLAPGLDALAHTLSEAMRVAAADAGQSAVGREPAPRAVSVP